jgi:hypothetical protein
LKGQFPNRICANPGKMRWPSQLLSEASILAWITPQLFPLQAQAQLR